MLGAIYFLILAGVMFALNTRIYRSSAAKALSWYGGWAAVIASVFLAGNEILSVV